MQKHFSEPHVRFELTAYALLSITNEREGEVAEANTSREHIDLGSVTC